MPPKATKGPSLASLMDEAALTPLHWRVWFLSAMGVFLDGADLFVIGVAMPLIAREFGVGPVAQGLVGAAAVLGSVLGASFLGVLTDRLGRKYLFIYDLLFFILCAVASAFAWNIHSLIVIRFLLGIGIGADYPICASYISEFMPCRIRGRMLIGAFSFQAAGMVAAALVGLLVLKMFPETWAWRLMMVFWAIPATVIVILRLGIPESPRWLLSKGRFAEASRVLERLLGIPRPKLEKMALDEEIRQDRAKAARTGYGMLFTPRYLRRTVLATVPWFLMDIATYGVGLFTPIILATMAVGAHTHGFIAKDFLATSEAAALDAFLVAGFLLNILLVERLGRINLQVLGFMGMSLGMMVLALSSTLPGGSLAHPGLVFSGFIIFNLLMNLGPNATTFILPAELMPTQARASGHGLAAAMAKAGASLGIFLLPILKASWGIPATLGLMAVLSLGGAAVTWLFRVETRGVPLESVED